jgi:hypothetical protein
MLKHKEKRKFRLLRTIVALSLTCASLGTGVAAQQGDPSEPVNPVVQWNRNLLVILRTPGAQPANIHPTRSLAMMHAAIYDAVDSIDRKHRPYRIELFEVSRDASKEAAAAAAAHKVLAVLYPNFKAQLDTELQQSLSRISDGPDKEQGIRIGQIIGSKILRLRSQDGSQIQPTPFVFGDDPGDYQSTPPNSPKPQFTNWSHVTPFALRRANQFRPGPPPGLTSERYTDVFDEVKSLGIADSVRASQEQKLTGQFWNGAIQNYWNEITQTATVAHRLTTAESARLFALVNLTLADGVIAFYDAKYTYNFWRPVTAIRAAKSDKNPDTIADPDWLPEVGKTTPDPSYPGAHAVISAGAAEVLVSFFETDRFRFDVTSEVMPGVERSFTAFWEAAHEATLSRIFAGVHFRTDLTAGHLLGKEIARFVVDNLLTAR